MRTLIAVALVCAVMVAPLRAADTFNKVKLVVNTGDKGEEVDVVLRFEDDAIVVRSKGGTVLKSIPYTAVKSAEYSYSKSPRWKSGAALAVAIGVFALPIFFMKGKKHWLTIAAEKDFAVLRLDKSNYKLILPTFTARSGKDVETVADEK